MSADDDALQIREDFLARQLPQDLVSDVERCDRSVADRRAPRAPGVGAAAAPVDLVGRQRVAAAASLVRGETWRYDDRVLERSGEKCSREGVAKIVVGVAAGTVHHDERARNPVVARVEGVRAIDESVAGTPAHSYRLRTSGRCRCTGYRRRSGPPGWPRHSRKRQQCEEVDRSHMM